MLYTHAMLTLIFFLLQISFSFVLIHYAGSALNDIKSTGEELEEMKILNNCSDAYMYVGEHLGTPIHDA
jgi:hypothetical protein